MIYHCGSNGVFEALHHAVPVICIPLVCDEWDIARRLEVKGVGVQLDWLTLTSEQIVTAVETIIGDKRFAIAETKAIKQKLTTKAGGEDIFSVKNG